jgi:flavin-dependent thymidylate synthase
MNTIWRTTCNTGIHNIFEVHLVKPPASSVYLIAKTDNMEQLVTKVTRTYSGILEPWDVTDETVVDKAFEDMSKTKLQTPMEMLHFTWLITDVTRAFTHQLVRYRIGTAFAQESMRFYGKHKEYKVLVTGSTTYSGNLDKYGKAISKSIETYEDLLDTGVSSEDARGVLPTNILTSIFFDCSMRTLQNIYTQRMCCQAQPGEWQPLLKNMKTLIRTECGDRIADMLTAPYERGEKCGYRASFDRPCIWSNKDGKSI